MAATKTGKAKRKPGVVAAVGNTARSAAQTVRRTTRKLVKKAGEAMASVTDLMPSTSKKSGKAATARTKSKKSATRK